MKQMFLNLKVRILTSMPILVLENTVLSLALTSIHISFFFIFHEGSRDQANKLYQYLNRGFKGYPGLKSFVDVNLSLDTDKTIKFSNFESSIR